MNDTVFRWRLSLSEESSYLVVYGPITGNQVLNAYLGQWLEMMGQWFPSSTSTAPETILPHFVRQAIEFGLQSGWATDARGAAFEIEWRNEEFRLANQSDDSRNTNSA